MSSRRIKGSIAKEWLSPIAIATYIAAITAVVALVKEHHLIATTILALLATLLLISTYLTYQRYTKYKRYTLIDEDLRRMTHNAREFVFSLRTTTSAAEVEELTAGTIKSLLTSSAEVFTKITTEPCTASIMLERNGQLRTQLYCHQVSPERTIKTSGALKADEGVAGQALSTGDAVVWGPSTRSFVATREGHERHYLSGISVPIRTSMQNCGLLNIDSRAEEIFRKESHEEICFVLADHIGLVMDCRSLWKDLHV